MRGFFVDFPFFSRICSIFRRFFVDLIEFSRIGWIFRGFGEFLRELSGFFVDLMDFSWSRWIFRGFSEFFLDFFWICLIFRRGQKGFSRPGLPASRPDV